MSRPQTPSCRRQRSPGGQAFLARGCPRKEAAWAESGIGGRLNLQPPGCPGFTHAFLPLSNYSFTARRRLLCNTMNASDPCCQLPVLNMSHLLHLTELHTCKTTSVPQDISFTPKVSLCPLQGTPHPSPDSDVSACPCWPPFSTWVSWEGTPFRMSERHRDARGDAGQWFMSMWSLVRMVLLSVRLLVGRRTGSFHVSDGCK